MNVTKVWCLENRIGEVSTAANICMCSIQSREVWAVERVVFSELGELYDMVKIWWLPLSRTVAHRIQLSYSARKRPGSLEQPGCAPRTLTDGVGGCLRGSGRVWQRRGGRD